MPRVDFSIMQYPVSPHGRDGAPAQSADVLVRPGAEADLAALTDIYNHYVRETAFTFDTEPFAPEQRRPWLRSHHEDGPHRLLVAQDTSCAHDPADRERDGQERCDRDPDSQERCDRDRCDRDRGGRASRLLGYATSSQFRPKPAYDTSVEVSVYCAPGAGVGRGIGTILYQALFEALEGQDLHRAYAGLTVPNDASVRLHTRFGFELVGTYRQAGRKFGRYWDVARYEKPLSSGTEPAAPSPGTEPAAPSPGTEPAAPSSGSASGSAE